MRAIIYYDDYENSRTFHTGLPSNEIGMLSLVSTIAKFAWSNGIQHFDKVEFIGESTIIERALKEGNVP